MTDLIQQAEALEARAAIARATGEGND